LSASAALRDARRRQHHEKQAAEAKMHIQSQDPTEVWGQIEPNLDDALSRLGRKDRQAIVLRFLQGLSMAELASAIGLSQDAAKMRVHRALKRLRQSLLPADNQLPMPALMTAMTSAAPSQTAPTGLASVVLSSATGAANTTASSYAIAKGANAMMTWMKIKLALLLTIMFAIAGTAAVVVGQIMLSTPPATMPVVAAGDGVPLSTSETGAIHVSVNFRQIVVDGRPSDWQSLRKQIQALPAPQRAKTRLELSAASADLPVSAYFEAQAQGSAIVQDLGLAYLSNAGIKETPGGSKLNGYYYIGGRSTRPGVYSMDGRKINLKQALISAGMDEAEMNDKLDLIRKTPDGETFIRGISVSDLFDNSKPDIDLFPGDQIILGAHAR
jgi:hypothetical protein